MNSRAKKPTKLQNTQSFTIPSYKHEQLYSQSYLRQNQLLCRTTASEHSQFHLQVPYTTQELPLLQPRLQPALEQKVLPAVSHTSITVQWLHNLIHQGGEVPPFSSHKSKKPLRSPWRALSVFRELTRQDISGKRPQRHAKQALSRANAASAAFSTMVRFLSHRLRVQSTGCL